MLSLDPGEGFWLKFHQGNRRSTKEPDVSVGRPREYNNDLRLVESLEDQGLERLNTNAERG